MLLSTRKLWSNPMIRFVVAHGAGGRKARSGTVIDRHCLRPQIETQKRDGNFPVTKAAHYNVALWLLNTAALRR